MSYETLLRMTLVILSVALYANHHIIHRSPGFTRLVRRSRGGTPEIVLASAASLWTLSLLLWVFGYSCFEHPAPLPLWMRWTGVGAMIVCIPLSFWIYYALGANFSKKLELREKHCLVESGPYRYVRHPMYACLFLCAIATCFVTADYSVMAAVVMVIAAFLRRIRKEEAMLLGRFGDAYREYKRRTPALFPRLGILKQCSIFGT